MAELDELTPADRIAVLEILMPFALAGRIPHAAEINERLPPDDTSNPPTIARRRMIDRIVRQARDLRE